MLNNTLYLSKQATTTSLYQLCFWVLFFVLLILSGISFFWLH